MSISTKFGHSMSKGSRDTRGGPRRPPPVSGKDFLMPCGIGLRECLLFCFCIAGGRGWIGACRFIGRLMQAPMMFVKLYSPAVDKYDIA